MTQERGPFGARVYLMNEETISVYRTRKSGTAQNARYIVYPTPAKGRFLKYDDKGISDAIRDALKGQSP